VYASAAVDWISVLSAGLLGAIGGALGAAIGWLTSSKQVGLIASVVLVVGSQAVNQSFVRPRLIAWQQEAAFLAMPVYAAVKEVDPDTYAELLATMRNGARQRTGVIDLMNEVQAILNAKIPEYVESGTDEAIANYYETVLRRLEDTSEQNVETCHLMALGRPAGDVAQYLSEETQQASADALAALVRSTVDENATTEFDQDEAESDIQAIAADIIEEERDREILQGQSVTADDYERSCDLNILLYDQILQLPTERSAGLLRFLASQLKR